MQEWEILFVCVCACARVVCEWVGGARERGGENEIEGEREKIGRARKQSISNTTHFIVYLVRFLLSCVLLAQFRLTHRQENYRLCLLRNPKYPF